MKSPRKRLDVTPTKSPPRTPVKRPYFALSPTRTPTKRTPPKLNLSTSIHFLDTPPSPSKAAPVAGAVKPFTGGRLVLRNQVFRRNLFGILRERHKVSRALKKLIRAASPSPNDCEINVICISGIPRSIVASNTIERR